MGPFNDISMQKRLKQISGFLVALVIGIAVAVLLGWQFDIEPLRQPVRHVAMNPATALSFILSGLALYLLASKNFTKQKQIAGYFFSAIVLLIGILRLAGIFFTDVRVDHILFGGKLEKVLTSTGNTSRMAPSTAFFFILTVISLLLINVETSKKRMPAHYFVLSIFLFALLSLVGYLYQVPAFYGILAYLPVAIHTAVCFLLLSLAFLLVHPGKGIMKEITGPYAGSGIARLLIPVAIIIPIALGLLRLWGTRAGALPAEMGTAVMVLSIIIIFLVLTWFIASSLNKKDFQGKQIENALRQSEEQIQSIFKAAPDAVVVIDEKSTILNWNPKAEKLFGWKVEEVVGKLLSDTIIPHRYRQAHIKGLEHFLKTGEGPVLNKAIEIQAIRKGDAEFDVSLSISPAIVNEKYLFIGFIRDITEQKKAEEQVAASNKRFTTVFNVSPMAISINDAADRTFMYVNDAFCEISGYKREELIGKRSTDLNIVTIEDQEKRIKLIEKSNEKVKGVEIKLRKANGEIMDIINSLERIEIDNKPCWVSAFVDITEQKKAEDKFKSLLESAPDAMIIANEKGEIVLVNQQTEILFGYKKEELIGQQVEILLPVTLHQKHTEHRAGYFKQPKVRSMGAGLELFALRKDGTQFPVEISLSPLETAEGTLVSAAIRDITERKKAEETFKGLLESAPDAMVIANKKGKIVLVNQQTEILFGYKKGELIDQNVEILLPINLHQKHTEHRARYFKQPRVRAMGAGLELFAIRKDGTQFPVEISLSPLETTEGTLVSAAIRDITERKKAEETFKGLLESAPDAMVIANEEGKIVLVNHQTELLFGYKKEEMVDQHVEILLPLNLHKKHAEHRANYFRQPKVRAMGAGLELFAIRKDGTQFPVEISLSPLETTEGTLVSAAIRDITERKKAEETFKGLLESAPDAMIIANKKGEIVLVNHQTEILFGYKKEELIHQQVEILLPANLHKNHIKHRADYFGQPRVREMGAGLELFAVRKDGSRFPVEISLSPLETLEGTLVSAAIRDITERKQTQAVIQKQKQDIQDFIDSMSTLCAKVATDGRLLMVNKTALLATGLTMEELLKTNFLEGHWWKYDPEVHARVNEAFQKACSGVSITYDEKIFVFGQVLTINFSLIPIMGLDGKVDYIVAEGRDITSLKVIENVLQKKTEELEKANKELEAFSYSVSHDLRAPLRIIDGYAEMLVTDHAPALNEDGNRILSVIKGNAQKMGALIDDLLNLSRLGRKELIMQRVDMDRLVKSIIAEQDITKTNHIQIQTGKLEPAYCDSSLIRQVWINLISNAIKYSRGNEKQVIEIKSFKSADEIIYSIKDNGVGFDMQYAHKLFGVFQRLHKMTEYEGTGVGLALVHRIVSRHGGRVWAEAAVNKGATFYFSLPVAQTAGTNLLPYNQTNDHQTN